MFKGTMKEIVKATQGAAKWIGSPTRRLSQLRSARRPERVTMWYGDQRAELTVDAWLRGH